MYNDKDGNGEDHKSSTSTDVDEEDVLTLATKDDDGSLSLSQEHPRRRGGGRWLVRVTLVLVVVVVTIIALLIGLDVRRLRQSATTTTVTVQQVVVDVRGFQPVVMADFGLPQGCDDDYPAPRWLTYRLQQAKCRYRRGNHEENGNAEQEDFLTVNVDFVQNQQRQQGAYALTATVPKDEVPLHAAVVWQSLVQQQQEQESSHEDMKNWQVTCEIDIQVQWKRSINLMRYQRKIEWNMNHNANDQQDETDHVDNKEKETTDRKLRQVTNPNNGPEETNDKENVVAWSPRVNVQHWGPQTLQVYVTFGSGHASNDLLLQHDVFDANAAWTVLLPAVHLQAQAGLVGDNEQQQQHESSEMSLHLQLPETNATILWNADNKNKDKNSQQQGDENDNATLVFSLSCQEPGKNNKSCPWYRGVANTILWRGNNNEQEDSRFIDIDIVDAQDSFIEAVLGHHNAWIVDYFSTDAAKWMQQQRDTEEDHVPPNGRQLQSSSKIRGLLTLPTYSEAKANCLQVRDAGGTDAAVNMDVAMCLLVDTSAARQGQVITTVNMTFYDTALAGVGVSQWFRAAGSRAWQVDMQASFDDADPEAAGKNRRINLSGGLVLDYHEEDAGIDWRLSNDGSWWPMTSILLSNGTAFDSVLDMTLYEATLHADGKEYLTKATGAFFFDLNELVMKADISDAEWKMSAQAEMGTEYRVENPDPFAPPTPAPTPRPTESPTSTQTLSPTQSANTTQTVSFFEADINYFGAISIPDDERDAVEEAFRNVAEDFYASLYSPSYTTSDGVVISEFYTKIDYVWVSELEYISYDQAVTFRASAPPTEALAAKLLTEPLEDSTLNFNFFDALRLSHPRFATIVSVSSPILPGYDENDESTYDDYYNDDEGTTEVRFFRVNSTGTKGDPVWDMVLSVDVFSKDYSDVDSNTDYYSGRDLTNSIFNVDFTETVEEIGVKLRTGVLSEEQWFSNSTTYDYTEIEDNVRLFLDSFALRWGSTQYVNMSGNLFIDYISQAIAVHVEDDANMDLTIDIGLEWYSEDDSTEEEDVLHLEHFDVASFDKSDIYVDLATGPLGTLYEEGKRASLTVSSLPGAKLQLETTLQYSWNETIDVFRATFDEIVIGWEGVSKTNAAGDFVVDLDADTIDFTLEDSTVEPFLAVVSLSWYDVSDSNWGLDVKNAFLRTGNFIDLNGSGSFRFRHVHKETGIFVQDNGDPFGALDFRSKSSSATMQLDMGMNFTWFEDDEYLQVVLDKCRMVFKEEVYLDTGVRSFAGTPTGPATTPSPAVVVPPPPKNDTTTSFYFTAVTMRLQGAGELSPDSVTAFENALKAYYETFFSSTSTGRRFLQADQMTNFVTAIFATEQDFDAEGNTITYDQRITFVPVEGQTLSATDAQQVLAIPLANAQQREEFAQSLQTSDPAFADLSSVDEPNIPPPNGDKDTTPPKEKDDDDDNGIPLFVFIVAAIALCCCCGGAGAYVYKNRENNGSRDKILGNDNDHFPEQQAHNEAFADEGGFNNNVADGFENNFDAMGTFGQGGDDDGFDNPFHKPETFSDNPNKGEEESSSGEEDSDGEYSSSGSDDDEGESDSDGEEDGESSEGSVM